MEARILRVLSLSLMLFSLTSVSGQTNQLPQEEKTWCVAKPSSDDATLSENLNFACAEVDCKDLYQGGSCFQPDNLMSHASLAMNLYYQTNGRNYGNCDFKNSALVVKTDPSFDRCAYAYVT